MDYLPVNYLSPLLGRRIDPQRFSRILWRNGKGEGELSDCDEFYCANLDFLTDGSLCAAAGITERLKDYWYTKGINLHVYLYLCEGLLRQVGVFKYKEDCWALRADIVELNPTLQELRVARRMVQYFIELSE